jgi:hypothetical protein
MQGDVVVVEEEAPTPGRGTNTLGEQELVEAKSIYKSSSSPFAEAAQEAALSAMQGNAVVEEEEAQNSARRIHTSGEQEVLDATIISKSSSSPVAEAPPEAAFFTRQGNVVVAEEEATHPLKIAFTSGGQELVEATSISEPSSSPVAEAVPEVSSLKKGTFCITLVPTVGKYPWNGVAEPNASRPWRLP